MNYKMNSKQNKPFLLAPAGKDYLWGGTKLRTEYNKNINMTPLSETWECSAHADGPSIVADGEYKGRELRHVLVEHPEYLGSHPIAVMSSTGSDVYELPILVKFIDAARDLSIQVHPDDDYARNNENGSLGKSEMWYVIDAEPGSYLIYGFNRNMTEGLLRRSLSDGTIENYLHKIPVQKDDVFFVEAGTVHAIGAGVLLAEIQESSNLTYRLYDYERLDKNGLKRSLHIEKALTILNFKSSDTPRQPMRVLRYRPGFASELLCRCKYFQVERLLINTGSGVPAECSTTDNSFNVLLCLEGEGILNIEDLVSPYQIHFNKGDCLFLPASSVPLYIHGSAQMLRIGC